MPGFTESSITLNFPDDNWFRFNPGCAGYAKLSGNGFKEMDACWYDNNANIFWIFELKDFTVADITLAKDIEGRSWNLIKKAVDTLCMFVSSKHAYPFANEFLNPFFSYKPDDGTQFKFVSIIHCSASQKTNVQLINNFFRNKFIPYAKLFNIQHYTVVEHSKAISNIPYNIVQ